MKYYIFLGDFTLEDYGQIVLQFTYYERFHTKLETLTIVKSVFMIFKALKDFLDLACYSVDRPNGLYK